MTIIGLDMEGILAAAIWIALAEKIESPGIKCATCDEFSMRPWWLWENELTEHLCAI